MRTVAKTASESAFADTLVEAERNEAVRSSFFS
jgi:hypothetical protein